MDDVLLKRNMEQMQSRLYQLVEKTGSLVDPRVVELSQQIDYLVVTLQQRRMKYHRTSTRKNSASF
ncbi:aspartyl-phosphate phosphatase Spo0E family protein [Paenibacillus sp. UNC451MF]|uniref:aspartyl-phosphate phosphatase Spo0E family protein n=1 Tax=Paenibacillus sp. UNC451MF TaxID=1449063 RepID=UPI00055D7CE6|nr:aspartyl-phosphate phosphatase Spo0E family protein [Paenibacillus sp. UNC451MF]